MKHGDGSFVSVLIDRATSFRQRPGDADKDTYLGRVNKNSGQSFDHPLTRVHHYNVIVS